MTITYNSLNTVLKVKNSMVVWVSNSCQYISCWPLQLCGWLGPAARYPVRCCERRYYFILLAQERSTFKILSTVSVECVSLSYHKVKNHKSNHCKLGTIYTYLFFSSPDTSFWINLVICLEEYSMVGILITSSWYHLTCFSLSQYFP